MEITDNRIDNEWVCLMEQSNLLEIIERIEFEWAGGKKYSAFVMVT